MKRIKVRALNKNPSCSDFSRHIFLIMKTKLFTGLVLTMVLVGCTNPPSKEKSTQQLLLGEWQMTKYLATDLRNNQTQQVDIVPSDSIWRFTEDSLYEHFNRLNTTTHYEIDEDSAWLVLHFKQDNTYRDWALRIISLTDQELILQTVDTWSGRANDYNFISARYEFSRYSYHHEPIVYDEKWAQQMMIGYWVATDATVSYSASPGELSFKTLNNLDSIRKYSYAEWLIDEETIFFEPRIVTEDLRTFPYELNVSGNWYELNAPGLFDFDPEVPHNTMEYIPALKSPVTVALLGKYTMTWEYKSGWNGERYTYHYTINYEKRNPSMF